MQTVPIIVESEQVERVAVIRRGARVFVGASKSRGRWFEHTNTHLARATEEALKRHLSAGWKGSVEELVEHVRQETEAQGRAHAQVVELERRVSTLRAELAQVEERLQKARALRGRIAR